MPEQLLEIWLHMLRMAIEGEAKAFKLTQENFNRVYRRATNDEQGEYHRLLAVNHREMESVHG